MPGKIALLVGTTKGAFLIEGKAAADDWTVGGPHCGGWPINHAAGDPATGTIWAGGGGAWHGAGVWRSADGGRSWEDITAGLPSTFGFPIRVHPHDPDTIWTLPLNGDTDGRYPPGAAAAGLRPGALWPEWGPP